MASWAPVVAGTAAGAKPALRKPQQRSMTDGLPASARPGGGRPPAAAPNGGPSMTDGLPASARAGGSGQRPLSGGAPKPMPEKPTARTPAQTGMAPRYQRMLDRGVDPAFVEARQAQHAAGTLPGQLQKPPVEAGGGMMGAGPRPLPGYGQPKPMPAETSVAPPPGATVSSVPPEIEGRMAQLAQERGYPGVGSPTGRTPQYGAEQAEQLQRLLNPSVSEMPMELPRNLQSGGPRPLLGGQPGMSPVGSALQSINGGGLRGFGVGGGAGMAPPDQAPPAAAEGGSPFAGLAQASMLSRLQGMNGGGLQGLPQPPLSGSPRLGNASLDTLRDPRLVRNSMAGF